MSSVTAKANSGYKCRVLLHQCLAIVVRKEGCRGDPGDFWMYENGYLLFQGLLSSNSVCWWNTGLNGATKSLIYHGYISPGALLVGSEPCAVDIVKNAWARRVLQPPPGYQIVALEDIENCFGTPIPQTQWTPLPEAVCAVVLKLSRQGRPAGIETIREALIMTFPHVSPPSEQALYDTLVQLTTERKLYHTSNGYFIVTPERRRSRSASRGRRRIDDDGDPVSSKTMLMSTEEALVMVHGDMATIRDGDVTHQLIQTNLADVICGGNSSDKILYPRSSKYRSSSFSVPRSPDRRGSFRLWRSSRRLRRSASTRTIAKHHYVDTSSSTETSSTQPSTPSPKKESLLSRLFRKTKRSQCQISSFSAQFPPTEWFNSKAVHLHSIGTQTSAADKEIGSISSYLETCEIKSSRSATLPRRRCRQYPDLPYPPYPISRENSPVSRKTNPTYMPCTLPRNPKQKSRDSSRKTSRSSLVKQYSDEQKPEPAIANSRTCDNTVMKTSQKLCKEYDGGGTKTLEPPSTNGALDNSGPSSIESQKSSTKTESSFNSGPSSIESHKTVINTKDPKAAKKTTHKREVNKNNRPPSVPQSNSFTLQVTTNQGLSKMNNKPNATTTTTINGEGGSSTKIFVQNSPVRSVITFENGQCDDRNPNFVIINDTEGAREQIFDSPNKIPAKNTNQSKETMNNSRDLLPNGDSINEQKNKTMNNSRKLSLQLPNKDGLSFHNLIKNVSPSSHNQFSSNSTPDSPIDLPKCAVYNSSPPSPTKSSDAISMSSIGNIYIKNEMGSLEKTLASFDASKKLEKNILGSEPNISYKEMSFTKDNHDQQFPSLNDLTFNFTSLAAQKILKGVGLNSVDTLVELNMTNVDKQNNCDVVHTDFGMF